MVYRHVYPHTYLFHVPYRQKRDKQEKILVKYWYFKDEIIPVGSLCSSSPAFSPPYAVVIFIYLTSADFHALLCSVEVYKTTLFATLAR